MNKSELIRFLRSTEPDLSISQLAERAGTSHGNVWNALSRMGMQANRPSEAQINARKLRTTHPDMSQEEIARRCRLPLREVVAALTDYQPRTIPMGRKRSEGRPGSCTVCGQAALRGKKWCFVCVKPAEARERALQFAKVGT